MVCCQNKQHGFRVKRMGQLGCGGNGRARIAAGRFQHDAAGNTIAAQLVGDNETEVFRGHDHRIGEECRVRDAGQGLFKGRGRPQQGQELLGKTLA